jgi:serine/threonine protein kinase
MALATFGPYRLDGEIGRGGMGVVYRAFDRQHGRFVALKVLPPDLTDDATFRDRFTRESRIVATLTDPHVIPIHTFGEIDGRLFLDMRLVDGEDVRSLLRSTGPLSPIRAVSVVSQVADALDAAHADGVVHRDVKPSNVLVARHVAAREGREDFAYLVDFGIARSGGATSPTTSGVALGTLDYMSPERFDGVAWSPSADVYALGCLLFECLTGSKPFPNRDLPALMRAHYFEPPPRPSQLRPGIPPALDAVVAMAMAKDVTQRFPTAGSLADAARAAVGISAAAVSPGPANTAPSPWQFNAATGAAGPPAQFAQTAPGSARPRRRPSRGRLVAAVLALLVVIGAGFLVSRTLSHNTESCGSAAVGAAHDLVACSGAPIPSSVTRTSAATPSVSVAPVALTPDQATAAAAIGPGASCTPILASNAPAGHQGFVDAGVQCRTDVTSIGTLSAFHLTKAGASQAQQLVETNINDDTISATNPSGGAPLEGTFTVTFAQTAQLIVVWQSSQVEVVATAPTGSSASKGLFTAQMEQISWQYGRFGAAPDYGSQASLRLLIPSLTCQRQRLEELYPDEFQTFLGYISCPGPTAHKQFTLFQVDQLASDEDLNRSRVGQIALVGMKSFKPRAEDLSPNTECQISALNTYTKRTTIYCTFLQLTAGATTLSDVEFYFHTTLTPAQATTYFSIHSLLPPTFLRPV